MSYVLIVDDDPDAREILKEIVEALGVETVEASDGKEAVTLAYKNPPALILLDIMMPHMNGLSVLAQLHSVPATRRVPVIIFTACGLSDRSMLMLPGVSEVVPKGNFSIESMSRLVAGVLGLMPGKDALGGYVFEPRNETAKFNSSKRIIHA